MNNLPQRKQLRLKGYNYNNNGYYFITICTKNRKKLLSKINVGVAAHSGPKIELTNIGKIIKKYIQNYNLKFKNIRIDEYIIMPDHIHLIIKLFGSPKAATPTISNIINSFKTLITKEIGYSIWQRNYYEHIIRNEKEYLEIIEYIYNNPIRWMDKNNKIYEVKK